ncbi:MAG: ATP F0F1 synthase subunit B [Rubellimicrobium sp.]|nr:ATP F0F1 synthase subunit B [Rubellimicrobium sp.]
MTDWKRLLLPAALALSLSGLAPVLSAQEATTAAEPAVAEAADTTAPAAETAEDVAAGALAEEVAAPSHAPIPFFSLYNTNFVVLVSFLIFVGVLVFLRVPGLLGGLLDKRATTIRGELDEARSLREEAQALLASFEKKHKDVAEQAARIVAQAREEATRAADQAREDIAQTIARRLGAAEDQIRSAEARAVREVRDQAVAVAIDAARGIIARQMNATQANHLIDDAIEAVGDKLH